MDPQLPGAWFVYSFDMQAYPIALYDNELDACRWVVANGYGSVKFWPFGKEWGDVKP